MPKPMRAPHLASLVPTGTKKGSRDCTTPNWKDQANSCPKRASTALPNQSGAMLAVGLAHLPDVGQMAVDCSCRRHRRRQQVRATALALATLKVSV